MQEQHRTLEVLDDTFLDQIVGGENNSVYYFWYSIGWIGQQINQAGLYMQEGGYSA